MVFDQLAQADFEHASAKGFWRRILTWFTGEKNRLLPFDAVREKIPVQGQRYTGLHQVPIKLIVGSAGRHLDFDRYFMPLQTHTKDRWLSIDKAHYQQVNLPPVDLYKIGEAYFVKDGNHRVSVARERGQEFIDAYVTEIDVPVSITADLDVDDLELKRSQALFLEKTNLFRTYPGMEIEASQPGVYELLMEHIEAHGWYLGEKLGQPVSLADAASSWAGHVYKPLEQAMTEQGLLRQFPKARPADLYLWIIRYQWYLRSAYQDDTFSTAEQETEPESVADAARQEAARQLSSEAAKADAAARNVAMRLARVLKRAAWVDDMVLQQERAVFLERTQLLVTRPQANVQACNPGVYARLLEHIRVHRWYLGEQRNADVPLPEAAVSWYDNVFLPLVEIGREQDALRQIPDAAEVELYLWTVEHRALFKSE